MAITAGDFNSDGNQDVAVIASGQVDVLYGNGSGARAGAATVDQTKLYSNRFSYCSTAGSLPTL